MYTVFKKLHLEGWSSIIYFDMHHLCRVVSKSWLSATSTPRFMVKHHRRQPSLPIIDMDGRPATFNIFRGAAFRARAREKSPDKDPWSFLIGSKNLHEYSLKAACDGFLIVHRQILRSGCRFYIYIPVTRKHALLPQPQLGKRFYNTIIGFYRHHPAGEYRCSGYPGHDALLNPAYMS